jgi:hypothetical protein
MRSLLPAGALVSTLLLSPPASAAWKDYVLPDVGVVMEFPNPPKRETGTYKTEVVGEPPAAAIVYSASEDNIDFTLTVVDLRAPVLTAKGANIMGECYFLAEQEGTVRANMAFRAEDGTPTGVRGRWVAVDLKDDAGLKRTSCLVTNGRLYRSEALILPAHEAAEAPTVLRFINSLRFTGNPEP